MKTAQIREIRNAWIVIKTSNKTIHPEEEYCETLLDAIQVLTTFLKEDN